MVHHWRHSPPGRGLLLGHQGAVRNNTGLSLPPAHLQSPGNIALPRERQKQLWKEGFGGIEELSAGLMMLTQLHIPASHPQAVPAKPFASRLYLPSITSSLPSPAKTEPRCNHHTPALSSHPRRVTGLSAFWFNDEQFTVGWNTPRLLRLNRTGWVLKNLMKLQPNLARISNAFSGEERLWQSGSASAGIGSVSQALKQLEKEKAYQVISHHTVQFACNE